MRQVSTRPAIGCPFFTRGMPTGAMGSDCGYIQRVELEGGGKTGAGADGGSPAGPATSAFSTFAVASLLLYVRLH